MEQTEHNYLLFNAFDHPVSCSSLICTNFFVAYYNCVKLMFHLSRKNSILKDIIYEFDLIVLIVGFGIIKYFVWNFLSSGPSIHR